MSGNHFEECGWVSNSCRHNSGINTAILRKLCTQTQDVAKTLRLSKF